MLTDSEIDFLNQIMVNFVIQGNLAERESFNNEVRRVVAKLNWMRTKAEENKIEKALTGDNP